MFPEEYLGKLQEKFQEKVLMLLLRELTVKFLQELSMKFLEELHDCWINFQNKLSRNFGRYSLKEFLEVFLFTLLLFLSTQFIQDLPQDSLHLLLKALKNGLYHSSKITLENLDTIP